jgi:hypothetical protein
MVRKLKPGENDPGSLTLAAPPDPVTTRVRSTFGRISHDDRFAFDVFTASPPL